MDIIRFAIENPTKITVGVILIALFGLLAVVAIPVQLTPDVDRPLIRVTTLWPGRSPEEVERSILQEQEEQLKTIPGLSKMTSTAQLGQANIELEFDVGVPILRSLQEVSNKLNEVPDYPDDVERPVIKASSSAEENVIGVYFAEAEDPTYDVAEFYDYFDRHIKPYLERIPGVSEVDLRGGREHQVHVRVNPAALAQRGLTWEQFRIALQQDNMNESGGDLADGRLDVRYRVIGQYDALDRIRQTVLKYDNGTPIRVADVAEVALTLEKVTQFNRSRGKRTMALLLRRETGANVVSIMKEFRKRVDEINQDDVGLCAKFRHDRYHIRLHQVYDETNYINEAISLVTDNLWIGGLLAGSVLLLFLRSFRPTLIIALAIPISVVGTFVVMHLFGRNLNVVSLAGLSFAVGMVVDNAIVVLENIDRHLHMGENPLTAAYRGTKEVWGAVLSSTLTTIAVFAPVLTIQEEAGQLFYDIALAVCAAVGLSLVVSVTVIPAAGANLLKSKQKHHGLLWRGVHSLLGLQQVLGWITDKYSRLIHLLTFRSVSGVWARLVIIAVVITASVIGTLELIPPASYLPNGNRNFILAMMFTPPSYSYEQNLLLGNRVEQELRPYWSENNPPQAALAESVVVVSRGSVFIVCRAVDDRNPKALVPVLQNMMRGHPGCFGFAQQPSIFGRFAGGDSVDVELVCDDPANLRTSAEAFQRKLFGRFSPFSIRTDPQSFELAGPERQVVIDQVRAKELGLNVQALSTAVRALIDGAIIGDFNYEGDTIDLLLIRDPKIVLNPDQVEDMPLAVPSSDGSIVHLPLRDLVRIEKADASKSIKRIEQQRAISFTVNPPGTMALEEAQNEITALADACRATGEITPDVRVRFSGNADRLSQTRMALLGTWTGWNFDSVLSVGFSRFFLALLITYLLMAALFESFVYPFVIMFSVPMAMVGGFVGLALVRSVHPDQQLDTLTMLGFIILIGIVVNNAILLVHQALNFMRGIGEADTDHVEAMEPRQAIAESVRTRMRPIFMTTTTSVLGMLPLVVAPGSGSEIYRGLGGVVLGGLVLSTIFTLLVVPLMFSLVIDVRIGWARLWGREFSEAAKRVE
ncbi:MAG: Multidrug resistance protein MdtC [Planctomycetes bacterium ADurb.Bin126]|nr:MAG: Multidrug resistance protein MdtC [Planctomycetes bacterium ADurb.Bin126]HOD80795.1 efflux RND transporter permease subunit [Phycisphaerae bacterium]HQL72050.1 efflux RND transporter permease subunit [Phycisphaerae bacterium]